MTTQTYDALDFRFKANEHYTDDKFCKKAAALFADGKSKKEAADALGVKLSVADLAAKVHDSGRIAFDSQDELAAAVAKARDEDKQGWAVIGARAGGLSEGRTQALYEQATGKSYVGSRLPLSGRQRTEPRKPAPAKKAAPKAAITEAELEAMTVKNLQAFAEEHSIEVPSKTKKAEMVALIVAGLTA